MCSDQCQFCHSKNQIKGIKGKTPLTNYTKINFINRVCIYTFKQYHYRLEETIDNVDY